MQVIGLRAVPRGACRRCGCCICCCTCSWPWPLDANSRPRGHSWSFGGGQLSGGGLSEAFPADWVPVLVCCTAFGLVVMRYGPKPRVRSLSWAGTSRFVSVCFAVQARCCNCLVVCPGWCQRRCHAGVSIQLPPTGGPVAAQGGGQSGLTEGLRGDLRPVRPAPVRPIPPDRPCRISIAISHGMRP